MQRAVLVLVMWLACMLLACKGADVFGDGAKDSTAVPEAQPQVQ